MLRAALLATAAVAQTPAPRQQMYKCDGPSHKCVPSAAGVDLPTCNAVCQAPAPAPPAPAPPAPAPPAPAPPAPAPPTPSDTYKCIAGACTAAPDGVDIMSCAALCKPLPTPSPPAPPPGQQKYQCINGVCQPQPGDYGIDLPTCEAIPCGAPPTQQLYRCTSDQCTQADSGSSLADCQQLCHAPTPPAPPSRSCASGGCLSCLYKYVLQILQAVEQCLTLKIVKCIETSVVDIENLVRTLEKCLLKKKDNTTVTGLGDLAGMASVYKLQEYASSSGDVRMQHAVQRLVKIHDTLL